MESDRLGIHVVNDDMAAVSRGDGGVLHCSDPPVVKPCLGWKAGQRSGKDISGGRKGVPFPWVNEVDDEPFPRYAKEVTASQWKF